MSTMYDNPYKDGDAERFCRAVGARGKHSGDELIFDYCPYCGGGQRKDKNTFSMNTKTGQFECKRSSCGIHGNIVHIANDFSDCFEIDRDAAIYYNINGAGDKFKRFKDAHRKIETRVPAIAYLQNRGIPEDVVRKYEITSDPKNDKVLIFPFKDETGELLFVKYRNTEPKEGQSKEWSIKGNYKKILFGMNQCEDFKTLVITEGQIDSLSCAAAGIKNAVSVPTGKNGFTWKPHVWNWLVRFDEIVVFGDNEHGTITLAEEISGFFPKKVRVVRPEDYKGCKDANELLQRCGADAVRFAVEHAEIVPDFRIKDLSNVEKVDLEKLKAYPTKFQQLDDAIGRGFHDGEVIILTGKCGEGKSTFASQIVARMIQNGLKCFCYSGELPDWMFKTWIDYQIAGTKQLTSAKRNAIDDWYRGKCFIYDNSAVIDEKVNLQDLLVKAVKNYECKFFLIDNLMTAMEDEPDKDLFRQQSKFLTELTKFAKGFNVIVLLVAHPRKGSDISNDSISGSGDITNRANIVLRYQRADDNEHSRVMITKNRTTGKLLTNKNGILVSYDENSMRISENGKGCADFMEMPVDDDFTDEIPEDIPF